MKSKRRGIAGRKGGLGGLVEGGAQARAGKREGRTKLGRREKARVYIRLPSTKSSAPLREPKEDNKLLVSSSVVNATSGFLPLCPDSIRSLSHTLVCWQVFQIIR